MRERLAKRRNNVPGGRTTGATVGYDAELWQKVSALGGSMDAAEYKPVVLGLIAIHGIDGQIAHGDTFHDDRLPVLKADFILANPPFNVSDWGGERLCEDRRWKYGIPPARNANFAWVQHIVHPLAPRRMLEATAHPFTPGQPAMTRLEDLPPHATVRGIGPGGSVRPGPPS